MIAPTFPGVLLSGTGNVNAILYVNMGVLIFAAAIVMIFGKETKQKSLESIQQ